jgi:hypothetical protein
MRLLLASLLGLWMFVGACAPTRIATVDQRSRWRAMALSDYSFEHQWRCFCPQNMLWWRVEVRNGKVVNATLVDPADTLATAASTPPHQQPTIETIFDALARALAVKSASVRVVYDSTFHFPAEIVVDESKAVADDEWEVRVRNFRRLR